MKRVKERQKDRDIKEREIRKESERGKEIYVLEK